MVAAARRAIVPLAGIEGARRLWVRNGLGRATEAMLDAAPQTLRDHGFVVLRLLWPLPVGEGALAPTDPFAGSPGFALGYPASADAAPAWPALHAGFLGGALVGPAGRDGARRLGIELPPGLVGGPVFDAAGRLAGESMPGRTGEASLLPASLIREVAQTV